MVATTVNLTVTYVNGTAGVVANLTNFRTQAALALDGVTLVVGNRILVKDQPNASNQYRICKYKLGINVNYRHVSVIIGTLSTASLWMLTSIVTTVGTDSFTSAKIDQNSFTSILGTTTQIAVSVTDEVAANSIAANPVFPGTASVTISTGTTVQRPVTQTTGMLRFNTSL